MEHCQAAVFDMDGTLLDNRSVLRASTCAALSFLRLHGVRVIVCSGRPLYSLKEIVPAGIADCLCACNGQTVCYPEEDLTVSEPYLSYHDLKRITAGRRRIPVIYTSADENGSVQWTYRNARIPAWLYDRAHETFRRMQGWKIRSVTQLTDDPPVNAAAKICIASTRQELLRIQKELSDSYACYFVGPLWLEIMHHSVGKGAAVGKILERYGIDPSECIAFGDGENDIPLFDVCGTGIAMGNAMRALKKRADDITLSNEQDGAAVWIRRHISLFL